MIRSPIDGIVISGDHKVGDFVEPNKLLIELAATTSFRFEAQLPTDEVAHVAPDMPARIKLDAYDDQRYGVVEGVVGFVSPDSSSTEEPELRRYVVRVALPRETFGRGELQGRLKFGMTGQMEIVTQRRSLLSLLVSNVRQRIRLG